MLEPRRTWTRSVLYEPSNTSLKYPYLREICAFLHKFQWHLSWLLFLTAQIKYMCDGLNEKWPPQAHVFEHLIPQLVALFGELWNLQEIQPWWRKNPHWRQPWEFIALFLFLSFLFPGNGWKCDQPASCSCCTPTCSQAFCHYRLYHHGDTKQIELSLKLLLIMILYLSHRKITNSSRALPNMTRTSW